MISAKCDPIRAAACGAAALLAGAFMSSCSDTSTGPEPPVEKTLKIAFISTRDGNGEIYVMNGDGTNQRRLTHNDGGDGPFSWSPDGSKICYVSEQPSFVGIYVMDADGAHQKLLTQIRDNEVTKPVWSPDGRKIAFSAYAEGSYEINVMNADGTNLANVTRSTWDDLDPTWSPDGSRIAFVIQDILPDGSRVSGVRIMDADGTDIESPNSVTCPVPVQGECATYRNTLWSPKDDAIAFVMTCLACPYADIWIAYRGQLTVSGYRSFDQAWSPDGSKLAFVSNRDGAHEIYVMNADGSNQTRLTHAAAGSLTIGAMWPAWSPDGSRIVYASDETGDFEIYIRDFTATRLTHTPGQDMFPACAMSAL